MLSSQSSAERGLTGLLQWIGVVTGLIPSQDVGLRSSVPTSYSAEGHPQLLAAGISPWPS